MPGRQLTKPQALITVELTQGREEFLHPHSEVKRRNPFFGAGLSQRKDVASMLVTSRSTNLKEDKVLGVTVSGLGAWAIGPVTSFKYGMRNDIMTKHVRCKDTHCTAARTQRQKTKQNENPEGGYGLSIPSHGTPPMT